MPDDNGSTGMGDADLAAARYALVLALGVTPQQRDELIEAIDAEQARRALAVSLEERRRSLEKQQQGRSRK
jgi:hypothetical protein